MENNSLPYKKTYLFTILISATIIIAVWLLGPMVAVNNHMMLASVNQRLVTSLVILLLASMVIIITLIKQNHQKYCPKQTDNGKNFQDGNNNEINRLKQIFMGAISFIKTKRIQQHHQQYHLHQLPLLLFIGNCATGKTSLLRHSDLNFILAKQFKQANPEATQHCNWWITKEALILDIAGGYLNGSKKSKLLLQTLLQLIRNQLKPKILRGIVITISISELLQTDTDKQYKNIINTLNVIQAHLQSATPLYIIITKCDNIAGFPEFFADITNTERKQLWGINFPQEASKNKRQLNYFRQQFNEIIQRLHQQVLWRLQKQTNQTKRGYIQDFPAQFERLRKPLIHLLKSLQNTNYGDYAPIEGLFFTSAQQGGEVIDTLVDPLAQSTSVQSLVRVHPTEQISLFIKNIFLEVLFKESSRQYSLNLWQQYRSLLTHASITAAVLVTLYMSFVWSSDLNQGIEHMRTAEAAIAEYKILLQSEHDGNITIEKVIAAIKTLHKVVVEIEDLDHSEFANLNWHNLNLDNKAIRIYQTQMEQHLIPDLFASIEFKNTQDAEKILTKLTHDKTQLDQIIHVITPNNADTHERALLASLNELKQTLVAINNAINPNQAAFQAASQWMTNKENSDVISRLILQSQMLPKVFGHWVSQIAHNSWKVIMGESRVYINQQWQKLVLQEYNNQLVNRYPLDKNSEKDVNLYAFNHFFHGNGVMEEFYNTYLRNFTQKADNGALQWRIKNGIRLSNNQETLVQLQRAEHIQQMLFTNSEDKLQLGFDLKPTAVSPNVKAITVSMNGKKIRFKASDFADHSYHFLWPRHKNSGFVTIKFEDFDGQSHVVSESGPWAWFRLMDQNEVKATDNPHDKDLTVKYNNNLAQFQIHSDDDVVFNAPMELEQFKIPSEI